MGRIANKRSSKKIKKIILLRYKNANLNQEKSYFLDQDKLAYIGRMSVNGEYELVDKLLLISKPSPVILDQLRKNDVAKHGKQNKN